MKVLMVFRASGEAAWHGEAESAEDALRQFYELAGWPPWIWIDGAPLRYDKNDPEHFALDLNQNWLAYLCE